MAAADHPLLPTQKNDVYRLIEGKGLFPGDFDWQVIESAQDRATVERLLHRGTGYFFIFDTNRSGSYAIDLEGDRLSYLYPGPEHPRVKNLSHGWEGQRRDFALWLDVVAREASTASLWDRITQEPLRAISSVPPRDNGNLNKDEKKAIEAGVRQARIYLQGVVDDPARLRRIEAKLDDIKDSSGRLGRRDFVNAALGAVVAIVIEAALNSDQANHLMRLIFNEGTRLLGQ